MKTEFILSLAATIAVIASVAAVAFNGVALGLFSTAVGCLVTLLAASEYAPRSAPERVPAALRRSERLPLAG